MDFDTEQATCPQDKISTWENPVTRRGTDAIEFAADTCRSCHVRGQCTRSTSPLLRLAATWPEIVTIS